MSPFDDKVERLDAHSDQREQWLEARRQGVGASDVAAIMGASDYDGPLSVYASKVGEGPVEDLGSEPALWGKIFEWPILEEYAKRTERVIARGGQLLRSREHPHQMTTLDAEQGDTEIAECKTVGYNTAAWKEEAPVSVQIQQQWQLMVTGASRNTLVWLPFPERELGWRDIVPHEGFQKVMAEEAREFWRRVELRSPPPPNAMDSARAAMRQLYPNVKDEAVTLVPSDAVDPTWLADQIDAIREGMRLMDANKKMLENTMRAALGETRWGLLPDGRYFSQSEIVERTDHCDGCGVVIREVRGHRRMTLNKPSRRKFPQVERTVQIDEPPNELMALLEASLAQLTEGKQ